MVRIAVQASSGAARFRVAVQAENIERVLEIAKKQDLGRNSEVTFPIISEVFSQTTDEPGAYEAYQNAAPSTTDEDELRVKRTEEELAAGTREREAGQLKVRKRVRTDREQIEVPTRHEEVSVERVPVEGEASEAEIGEEEVVVPVTEEEVVVEKRPVVKEEVRIRKDVVEDTETVEEDVRREEVEVEDETERRGL